MDYQTQIGFYFVLSGLFVFMSFVGFLKINELY